MGKGGKAQTVGYKYYLGMHLGLCHGPIDKITQLRCDDRVAWQGESTGGTIHVQAGELFGGDKREGGVSGYVDVMMGAPTQGQNGYLVSKLGALIPAYRGIVSLVFRGSTGGVAAGGGFGAIFAAILGLGNSFYLGNNPYLKPWSARGQRIFYRQGGIAQWNSANAGISASPTTPFDLASYFPVLQQGIDPDYPVPPGLYPNSITIGPYDTVAQVVAGNADGSGSCRPDDFFVFNGVQQGSVASPTYPGGTVLYTLPAGQTLLIQIRNTINELSGVSGSLTVKFPGRLDMNPAHIIRECLTDPDWGMGYTDDDIDEPSFLSAAGTFVNEGLGMSLLWDKTKKIEDFVSTVQEHVDAALYVSRKTGKFVLKPIRGGYNEATLLHLDESNIVSVEDPTRVAFGELTNSVTVTYWDGDTGKDATVTVTDTALVQQQGVVINAPLQYPGFTTARNATIAAQRDLRALSSPLLSCTITADSDAKELEIGDVFKFSWAKWGLVEVVMRVNGISYGTGRNNRVKIQCTQDVFDTDVTIPIVVPDSGWTDPSQPPSPSDFEVAVEAPYFELVQALGQSTIDGKLTTDPSIGYVIAAASQPTGAINATLYTDDGTGYQDVGAFDFAPAGVLSTDINKLQTSFVLEDGIDLDAVVIGTHVQIGDELMRVDALDVGSGAILVGRGVLDTVPAEHTAGTPAIFWDQFVGFDPTEYVQGEEIPAKITPISGAGVLPLDEAAELSVDIVGRAARPYAPGDFRINGEAYAPEAFYEGEVTLTWKHRDRLQQTAGVLVDAMAADIGPEPGTEYRVRVYVNDVLDQTIEPAVSPQPLTTINTGLVRVEVHSVRDGIYSFQAPSHTFINSSSRLTQDGELRYTEDGDDRLIEG